MAAAPPYFQDFPQAMTPCDIAKAKGLGIVFPGPTYSVNESNVCSALLAAQEAEEQGTGNTYEVQPVTQNPVVKLALLIGAFMILR